MRATAERLVRGERAPGTPSVEVLPERRDNPEWHSLRLFGRGGHPDAFDAEGDKASRAVTEL
jgi:hypothetical protein